MPATANRAVLATLMGTALLAPGCYEPEAMIERVRNDAIKTRLEEIDLGLFHVTLPLDQRNNEMTEVFLHVFGTSVRYRIDTIKKKLTEEEHLLKQSILVALRETTNEDYAEPRLLKLRSRIIQAVNGVLGDTPVERVGFYDIKLVRH